MHKIFLDPNFISDCQIKIVGEDFNHIKALRKKVGDQIIICDGNLNDYFCSVCQISKNEALLNVTQIQKSNTEPTKKIYLFQAMPKADKFEIIIQKAVELGVYKIVPIICEHCDVKNPPSDNKFARWQKISKSAAEQSGRGIIPQISQAMDFTDAIDFVQNNSLDFNIIAHEKASLPIKNLRDRLPSANSIGIFVGPEGGFSQNEIDFASQNNINAVSLGKRILRTETASLFLLSLITFETDF